MLTESQDGVLILIPQGEIAKILNPTVQDVLSQIRNESIKHVLFDLSKAEVITSPGFGWMFGIARECKRLGTRVSACNANGVVSRSLKWVNGNLVMNIVASRSDALEQAS